MKRVNNPEKYLKGIVKENDSYYIGFGVNNLTEVGKANDIIQKLITRKANDITITGKKGILKENTSGKYVRKTPEVKNGVWKHIEYWSNHHEKTISYDREFMVYEKMLLHKYNLTLSYTISPQGEMILHFPKLKFQNIDSHYQKAGVEMNIAILFGGYFMLYDTKFEPIIPVTKVSDTRILPSGQYGSVKEKLDTIEKNLNAASNDSNFEGNSYRFAVLRDLDPSQVEMGIGGFNEYLIFEYSQYNLMIFENLKTGNATYIFNKQKFNSKNSLNKQNARKDPAYVTRIVHESMAVWKKEILKHF